MRPHVYKTVQENTCQSKERPRKSTGMSAARASLDVMKTINDAGDVDSASIPEVPS